MDNPSLDKFSLLATDYCTLMENVKNFPKAQFISKARELLAGLYYYGILLPHYEEIDDYFNEQYVTEDLWDSMNYNLEHKFGQFNTYQEVFDKDYKLLEKPATRSLAEDLTDIYQDLKNFSLNQGVGNEQMLIEALAELKDNFSTYWGQSAVNILRALHNLIDGDADLSEEAHEAPEDYDEDKLNQVNTSNWLISNNFEENDNDAEGISR